LVTALSLQLFFFISHPHIAPSSRYSLTAFIVTTLQEFRQIILTLDSVVTHSLPLSFNLLWAFFAILPPSTPKLERLITSASCFALRLRNTVLSNRTAFVPHLTILCASDDRPLSVVRYVLERVNWGGRRVIHVVSGLYFRLCFWLLKEWVTLKQRILVYRVRALGCTLHAYLPFRCVRCLTVL